MNSGGDTPVHRALAALLAAGCLALAGCKTPPGDTEDERLQLALQKEAEVFADLDAKNRKLLALVQGGAGRATFFYNFVKLPLFPTLGLGGGGGYGVVTDHRTNKSRLMSVRRAEWGWGTVVTSVTLVIAFKTEKAFAEFVDGDWTVEGGAQASASVGGEGVDAGGSTAALEGDVVAVEFTETGAGVSVTVRALHFKPR